jgi:hypothetical protein
MNGVWRGEESRKLPKNTGSKLYVSILSERMLFTISVADIDEMLRKPQAGEKGESLEPGVCQVILAKSEREMKEMMRSLGKYARKEKLEVNVEKTKMMVFNKGKRKSEEKWK